MKKKSRFCYAANYYEITLYYTINNNNSHVILFWLGQIPSSTGGLSLSQSTNIEFAHSLVRIPPFTSVLPACLGPSDAAKIFTDCPRSLSLISPVSDDNARGRGPVNT